MGGKCSNCAVKISPRYPLLEVRHDYGDKTVLLDVHVVWAFSGEARGLENQPLSWVDARDLARYDFPAANVPIVAAVVKLLGDLQFGSPGTSSLSE